MIELYDLVGDNDLRFSPFCWRAKAVMAYKKIPYTTVPIRFCDKDKLAFSGQDRVPVIKDGSTIVSDSWFIAEYFEQLQPEPRLFPGPGLKEACRFSTFMWIGQSTPPCSRWWWPIFMRTSIRRIVSIFANHARNVSA